MAPETGTEMIGGEIRKVSPAEPPHAQELCNIAYVIDLSVAPGHVASIKLLTRVNSEADFAMDACIRKLGRDPETGWRHLEELAFEVEHTQSQADIRARARQLIGRGVRRVFAIRVREDEQGMLRAGPVKEWLASEGTWLELHPETEIVDPCLRLPVKVKAFMDPVEANNQAARALLAAGNPVLLEDIRRAVEAREKELVEAHARKMRERDMARGAAQREEL